MIYGVRPAARSSLMAWSMGRPGHTVRGAVSPLNLRERAKGDFDHRF